MPSNYVLDWAFYLFIYFIFKKLPSPLHLTFCLWWRARWLKTNSPFNRKWAGGQVRRAVFGSSLVCLCLLSVFPLSLPARRRWTMWRKAAAFKTPPPCWCPRRGPAYLTPRPTVSSPSPPPRWTAATITRMNTTTKSRWPSVLSSLPSKPANES